MSMMSPEMNDEREARLTANLKHEFIGHPSSCKYCEMYLFAETENEDCELATIAFLRNELKAAWEREKILREILRQFMAYAECDPVVGRMTTDWSAYKDAKEALKKADATSPD